MADELQWSINLNALVTGTEKADQLYWSLAALAREVRKKHENVSLSSTLLDGEPVEDIGPTMPVEFHDENTMGKVREALREALTHLEGNIDRDPFLIINTLQSYGILFRERR